MAIWERIWRANCAVAVFGGHAGTRTHGACKPGCGMGTPLRKATAQKRAPRIFSRGKQTGPGSAPRHVTGGGLRAGRAAAVRRATPPVLWRIGQDAMCSACHCPPLASRPETQWARYGFTDRAAVSLRATLPVLRRTGRDAGAFPRQANRTGVSISSRDRRRLARRPCSCCPARHPSRIAAHRARCRRFLAASKPDRGQHHVTGSAAACAQAVQLLSGAPPRPYFSITVERTGRGGRTVRVRARLRKRP